MFTGFPEAALDFYDDLEADNSKSFWAAHSEVYDTAVKQPMKELAEAVAEEFGDAKIFRPHRDTRFSKDKSPYKTYQDLYVPAGPALGWAVRVSAPGVMVMAGAYAIEPVPLRTLREVVAGPRGTELEELVTRLAADGWELGGDMVATVPRGFDKDHPRIELLRHKSIAVHRSYGFEPIIHTPALLEAIRDDWRTVRPLVEWLGEVLG